MSGSRNSTKNVVDQLSRTLTFLNGSGHLDSDLDAEMPRSVSRRGSDVAAGWGLVGPGRWTAQEEEEGSKTMCRKCPECVMIKKKNETKKKRMTKKQTGEHKEEGIVRKCWRRLQSATGEVCRNGGIERRK